MYNKSLHRNTRSTGVFRYSHLRVKLLFCQVIIASDAGEFNRYKLMDLK
jgi:hypothetical protein